VFEEMRIKPIWYTDHPEIHDFVKAIREQAKSLILNGL